MLPLLLVPATVAGQVAPVDRMQVESRSGHFVIHGPSSDSGQPERADSPFVRLTPSSLAIICSRVRAEFNRQLKTGDRWQDKIHMVINPAMHRDSDVLVAANRFLNAWQYQVQAPQVISKEKLARCIIRVLLQELANRPSRGRSGAVPLWLTEGLTKRIMADTKTPLFPPVKEQSAIAFDGGSVKIVENPSAQPFLFQSARYGDPLGEVKEQLRQFEGLTFAQFGEAELTPLSPEEWTLFQACAHLFVVRLLELPNGQAGLQRMLAESSNFLNWQLAFLKGFAAHFRTALDVEKWWSLQVFNISQPDMESRLSVKQGLDRLDAILDSSIAIRRGEEEQVSERDEFPLQVMMDLVEYREQRAAIMEIVLRLRQLRWRVSEDLLKLVDDYSEELNQYVARRDAARSVSRTRGPAVNVGVIVRQTLDRLKLLDVIREDIRQLAEGAESDAAEDRALQQVSN